MMKMFRSDGRMEYRYEWEDEREGMESYQGPSPGKMTRTLRLAMMRTAPLPGRGADVMPQRARQSEAHPARGVLQGKDIDERTPPQSEITLDATDSGAPLPEDLRATMELMLGVDFSDVRIHEGAQAASVGALAFTHGADIFFAPGQYQPWSRHGQELLGHELTHVVQQREGRVRRSGEIAGVAVNDDAALEREADEMGARIARASEEVEGRVFPADAGDVHTLRGHRMDRAPSRSVRHNGAPIQTMKRRAPPEQDDSAERDLQLHQEVTLYIDTKKKEILAAPSEGDNVRRLTGIVEECTHRTRSSPEQRYTVSWDDDSVVPRWLPDKLTRTQLIPGPVRRPTGGSSRPRKMRHVSETMDAVKRECHQSLLLGLAGRDDDEDWEPESEESTSEEMDEVLDTDTDRDEDGGPPLPISEITPILTKHRDTFTRLLRHGGQVRLSSIPVTTNLEISDTEWNRGDIATQDTFSVLFIVRDRNVRVVLRGEDGDVDAGTLRGDDSAYTYKNTKFPKKSPVAEAKLEKDGIIIERKQQRMGVTTRLNKEDYHSEEQLIDSVALEKLASDLVEQAAHLERDEAVDEGLEELRVRVVIAINRTSCRECAKVLAGWLREFWQRLETKCPSHGKQIREKGIYSFEVAAGHLYSESRDRDLEMLRDAGWELTAIPQTDEDIGFPRMGESELALAAKLGELWKLEQRAPGEEQPDELAQSDAARGQGGQDMDRASSTKRTRTLIPERTRVFEDVARQLRLLCDALLIPSVPGGEVDKKRKREVAKHNQVVAAMRMEEVRVLHELYKPHTVQGDESEAAPEGESELAEPYKELVRFAGTDQLTRLRENRKRIIGEGPTYRNAEKNSYQGGDCLFEAVKDSGGFSLSIDEMRTMTATIIRENWMRYLPYIQYEADEELMDAVERTAAFLAERGRWDHDPGDLAPIALADALGIRLHIHDASDGHLIDIVGPHSDLEIFVYYNGWDHYSSHVTVQGAR